MFQQIKKISIHLMLRFIFSVPLQRYLSFYFNTSHVKVYRACKALNPWFTPYFNTSHVKVYQNRHLFPDVLISISIHLMLRFIILYLCCPVVVIHFNTSHVKVYPGSGLLGWNCYQFQYISC